MNKTTHAPLPWQMTLAEFAKTATVTRGNNYISVRSPADDTSFVIRSLDTSKYTDADAIAASHRSYVQANQEGE